MQDRNQLIVQTFHVDRGQLHAVAPCTIRHLKHGQHVIKQTVQTVYDAVLRRMTHRQQVFAFGPLRERERDAVLCDVLRLFNSGNISLTIEASCIDIIIFRILYALCPLNYRENVVYRILRHVEPRYQHIRVVRN